MEVSAHTVSQWMLRIGDPSDTGEARRTAVLFAEQLGMDETERGAIAISVTELATNILKHAKHGSILAERLSINGTEGMRVLALDRGPGIRNIASALEDGYSTAGTAGNGLGAVRRFSTLFDIYSMPDRGTAVLAEFWPMKKIPSNGPVEVGALSIALQGEPVCGDTWLVKSSRLTGWLMVADGLGHGIYAAEAAREAERILGEAASSSPASIMQDCHDALKKTRGAAVAIATIDHDKKTLSFAGLGNISAVLARGGHTRGLASHNGTVGHQMARVQEFTFPWEDDSILIMHSDGLATRWNLEDYPGLLSKHPSLIAAILYRDFYRDRDDVTVLVARNHRG
jgi:anti-sigma regulatory factor (Ser/Thr protein kinase)